MKQTHPTKSSEMTGTMGRRQQRAIKNYRRDSTIASPGKPIIPGYGDPAFQGRSSRYNRRISGRLGLFVCHMLGICICGGGNHR